MNLAEEYILSQKYDDHFLIVADEQTDGRGRKGNQWLSPKGGLYFNIGLKHISQKSSFTLYIGVSILNALNYMSNSVDFKIKWPNDIYLKDYKVGGLICSQYTKNCFTSIGIGINTNSEINYANMSYKVNSIKNILDITTSNEVYLNTIINFILERINDFEVYGYNLIKDTYFSHDYLKEKYIKIISGENIYNGKYNGIGEDGSLQLINNQIHLINIHSGTVEIL